MIYVETKDDQIALRISTNLSTIQEICIADEIFKTLEKEKIGLPHTLTINRLEVDFKGINIKSGTFGDEERRGNICLLESVIRVLGHFKDMGDICEVADYYEGTQINHFRMSSMNILELDGEIYRLVVE